MIIGICSIYGNPLHVGHIAYLEAARKQCDHLTVIINNDAQVKVKGSIPFMTEDDRATIVEALGCVDSVLVSIDEDSSVTRSIGAIVGLVDDIYPTDTQILFFNSGDRDPDNLNQQEVDICAELGVEQVFLDLPKIRASSEILRNAGVSA